MEGEGDGGEVCGFLGAVAGRGAEARVMGGHDLLFLPLFGGESVEEVAGGGFAGRGGLASWCEGRIRGERGRWGSGG